MSRTLSSAERRDWLRLARTPRIGPLTFHRLIGKHGDAAAALAALPRLARDLTPPREDRIAQELEALEALGGRLLCAGEPDYPARLAALDAPPPVIAVRGQIELLQRPAVALVGAREASAAGLAIAERMAKALTEAGVVVVSGLARGTDAAAHRGALAGGTIAVLAGGLDRPYPPQNLALHAEIVERGLVVSEMPLGFQARAQDFPRRNFIVSGLSLGIVVIEAAVRSGSLITARAGAEQGRDVMAVPGSPLDPRGKGSNALIKQGATLVEDAEDVLAVIGATPQRASRRPSAPLLEPVEDRPGLAGEVLALLSPAATPIDEIARRAGAPIAAVAAAITELELDGRAATLAGGLVERR